MSCFKTRSLFVILLTLSILVILSSFIYSAEQFIYDNKDTRDPFVPLVTQQGKITTGLQSIGSVKDIVLEGIVWDPKGGSIVIINQNILKENDYIGDYQITKIQPNRVVLKKGDKEYVVILTKEGEE